MHNKRLMLKTNCSFWRPLTILTAMFEARAYYPGGRWACRGGSSGPIEIVSLNRLKLLKHVIINLQLATSVMLDISLTNLIQNRGSRWV